MNRYTPVFLMLLISMGVQAQGTDLATPEKTATVDSVSDELASIVVLCATQHESNKLQNEWAAYLRRNYHRDMDTNALIKEITRQAIGYWQIEYIKANVLGSGSRAGESTTQAEIHAKQKLQEVVRAVPGIERAMRNTAKATVATLKR